MFPTETYRTNLYEEFAGLLSWSEDGYRYSASLTIGNGWLVHIRELLEALIQQSEIEGVRNPVITDAKSKYGRLSIFADYTTDTMDDIIEDFERRSIYICEICGAHDATINPNSGWISSRCQLCSRRA